MSYYFRGLAYFDKGDFYYAIYNYDKAIIINPNDANFYYNRGNAYQNIKDF